MTRTTANPNQDQITQSLQLLPIDKVIPTPENPRHCRPDEQSLLDLAASIAKVGVLQPVVVRPHPDHPDAYDLRAGARRHMAAGLAGLKSIPAVVYMNADDDWARTVTATENLQREDLGPLEESHSVKLLLRAGHEPADVAARLGQSVEWVVRRAALIDRLSNKWIGLVGDPKHPASAWTAEHLQRVAKLEASEQDQLIDRCHFKDYRGHWQLPDLRSLDALIGDFVHLLKKARWKLDDDTLDPKAGACSDCQKRSSYHPGLFDDFDLPADAASKADKCLDPNCWDRKVAAFVERARVDLVAKHGQVVQVTDNGWSEKLSTIYEAKDRKCKAKTKGAAPHLVVDGPEAGRVIWAKLPPSGKPKGRLVDEANPPKADGKPKPKAPTKTLDERRLRYDRRRAAIVGQELTDAVISPIEGTLDRLQKTWGTDRLLQLLATFGASGHVHGLAFGAKPWNASRKLSTDKAAVQVWAYLLSALYDHLVDLQQEVDSPSCTRDTLNAAQVDHQEAAHLLGLDAVQLYSAAAAEVPYPKAFDNLNEDGTRKTGKPGRPKGAKDKAPRKARWTKRTRKPAKPKGKGKGSKP